MVSLSGGLSSARGVLLVSVSSMSTHLRTECRLWGQVYTPHVSSAIRGTTEPSPSSAPDADASDVENPPAGPTHW